MALQEFADGRLGVCMDETAAAVAGNPVSPLMTVPRWMRPRGLSLYCLCTAGAATVRMDLNTETPGAPEDWEVWQGPASSVFGGSMVYCMIGWGLPGDIVTGGVFSHHLDAPIPAVWKVKTVIAGSGTSTFKVHYAYWL